MVKYYNGEVFFIPKEFEKEIRADERTKCKCPYWNEEHQECATSFEEDIRADERKKVLDEVLDAFSNEWTLDSLACHENKYEILAIIKRQIEQLKE